MERDQRKDCEGQRTEPSGNAFSQKALAHADSFIQENQWR